MASSNGTRWRLSCDTCEASAWVGPAPVDAYDVWCEACQNAMRLEAPPVAGVRCVRCGAALPERSPRFVELWGELQNLDAVLGAWAGDASALVTLLPERPRFLTDLNPPASRDDDPAARRDVLEALTRGDWRAVLKAAPDGDARALSAHAIACERLGQSDAALAAWNAVLACGEDARARLARGALLARAGRFGDAASDLALAGDRFEARWNHAACRLHAAVLAGDGLPEPSELSRARAEAGEPSSYWSDPTVGRLVWSLLVERSLAPERGQRRDLAPGETIAERTRETLRAAEAEFEHTTFWDRSMIVAGWSRLGALDEAARVGAPLARELSTTLLGEPALSGPALLEVAAALATARSAMDLGDPVEARRAIAPALAREELRRFRIPCAACGRGTVGIEETAEAAGE